MEKIQSIILNKRDYKITSSAYYLLSDFLNHLKKVSKNSDEFLDLETQTSIIIDMELEGAGNSKLIEKETVEEAISIIKENRDIKYSPPRRIRRTKPKSRVKKNRKKFERNISNKIIGGVCSAIGDFLGISAVIVRILFILGAFLKGAFIPIYIILWIILPKKK